MASITIYAAKAAKYACYRWGYPHQAVEMIFNQTGLDQASIVIELGAGTGILTRQVVNRVSHLYAIEPDMQMNAWIREGLPAGSPISVIAAKAEAVPLLSNHADAVLVAQAIHWFNPLETRDEIHRLLKKHGWLVLLRNYGTDSDLNQALQELNTVENGVRLNPQLSSFVPKKVEYYYDQENIESEQFPFTIHQDWDAFLGGLTSASFVPEEAHPLFNRYREEARKVFEQFAVDECLET
ncbi:MAG: class I SAM-dependent methyltransferase, partial [Anaerolineaceae bacterium]|nr:class I SAM-dependent methyltransferase [Anaerolineaceae bacterium]